MQLLDLFSGVGGIAHALRGLGMEPAMYCERDPMAIAVLRQRMRTGDLPAAPIHTDVAKFPGRQYRGKIDVITGGFPCIGFSTAGAREGFDNPGSGLYKDVVRLVTEIQPSIVFLENVAAIRNSGLQFVAETLRSRGYNVSWVSLRGHHIGAPQHRHRWFCLATKTGLQTTLTLRGEFKKFRWGKEPCARMVKDKTLTNERQALLGNSVIPDLVRWAFLYLWTGSCWAAGKVLTVRSWPLTVPAPGRAAVVTTPPAHGFASGKNEVSELPAPRGLLPVAASHAIRLDPAAYVFTGPRNPAQKHKTLTAPITMSNWATPRHGMTGAARVLTDRSQRDLPTQIRFEARTPAHLRAGFTNPEFVEWLMGFPPGWTAVR